jgi:hypothetical protein
MIDPETDTDVSEAQRIVSLPASTSGAGIIVIILLPSDRQEKVAFKVRTKDPEISSLALGIYTPTKSESDGRNVPVPDVDQRPVLEAPVTVPNKNIVSLLAHTVVSGPVVTRVGDPSVT